MTESFTLNDVQIEIAGNIVGGCQSVEVRMEQDNAPIHENGSKKPREIRRGQITYTGSVERLFLDVGFIKDLVDLKNGDNPYFDIVGVTKNKTPQRKVVVRDAVFKGFSLPMALNDSVKSSMEFDALDLDIQ
jgi:hypothetical protein